MALTPTNYLVLECFLLVVTLIVVLARLGVRVWRRSWTFWVSDICLLVGVLCQAALFFGDLANFMRGRTDLGYLYDDSYGKWIFGAFVIFDSCFYFPRFSLLAFYFELFPISEQNMRIWLYIAIAYTTAGFITNLSVNLLWCGTDLSQNWRADSTCARFLTLEPLYINWSIGISAELLIFALPMPLLWKMKKLQRKEKTALAFVLFLGVVTIVVSTSRFTMMTLLNYGYETYLMGSAELMTQIIIVAVPALRPLLAVVKVPSKIRNWGNSASLKHSRSGTSTPPALNYYEPGAGQLAADDGESMNLPDIDVQGGSSCWQGAGRPYANKTSQSPEPWEALALPRVID